MILNRPALAPHRVGSAIAILNLAAGVSQFMGPVVAGLVAPIGVAGTIWVISGVYVVGIVLTYCLRDRATADALGAISGDQPMPRAEMR